MNTEPIAAPGSSSLGRVALLIFTVHAVVAVVLGHFVVPQFETMREPSASPPPAAAVLVPIARIFYFPIVSWAESFQVTDISRPGLGFVFVNSALVALVISVVWRILSRFHRAAA